MNFINDFYLVIDNCKIYNKKGTQYYLCAEKLYKNLNLIMEKP